MLFVEEDKNASFSDYFAYFVEIAFQLVGQNIRKELIATNADISSTSFPTLVRLACNMAHKEYCRMVLPFILLEDVFESSTVEQCEKYWSIILTLQDDISKLLPENISTNSSLALLSIANSLLRRTSKIQNGEFRGSVMM